jgi:hypothetical protein
MTPVANPLPASTPATVFLSYARSDEAAILPLERALQQRGLRVLRDKPSLPLGAHNAERLTAMIGTECDAVLFFVTDNLLASDFIWRYEVPAALAHRGRESNFHIIPVLQGVGFEALALHCADRGMPSLADFNAEKVQDVTPTLEEVNRIARRCLGAALALRLRRDPPGQLAQVICLRTFAYTPPSPVLHLDLDWVAAFEGEGPALDEWHDRMLPALADVAAALASHARNGHVEAWLKARLPVAVALGYHFPERGGLALSLASDGAVWFCSGTSGESDDLALMSTRLDRQQRSAIVEVAVARNTTPAVTQWRAAGAYIPGWRVLARPVAGPSRSAISTDAQARAWAQRIGDEVRRLWDNEGVGEIHLFVASSADFAVMVGQQMRDRHPVRVYFGDNDAGYRLACILGRRGA